MRALTSRFESEHAAIFVVGVRRRMHESRGRTEALEGEPKASRADVLWKRLIGRDLERQDGVGPTGCSRQAKANQQCGENQGTGETAVGRGQR